MKLESMISLQLNIRNLSDNYWCVKITTTRTTAKITYSVALYDLDITIVLSSWDVDFQISSGILVLVYEWIKKLCIVLLIFYSKKIIDKSNTDLKVWSMILENAC